MTGSPDEDPVPEPTEADSAAVRRAALIAGSTGVGALVAAVALYLAGGPPYGVNIGAGVLYLLGLLAALIAGVLLWMHWSAPGVQQSPRRPAGLATAAGALLMTGASVVVSLGRVGSPGLRLALIGAAAVVLAAAVAILAREPRPLL